MKKDKKKQKEKVNLRRKRPWHSAGPSYAWKETPIKNTEEDKFSHPAHPYPSFALLLTKTSNGIFLLLTWL